MFVVKGGTQKRADCLANECTAKSVWVNCPVCHNKTKTKIYQDTLALRFPMYCPKCKKEMRAISKRSKKVVQNKNAAQKEQQSNIIGRHRRLRTLRGEDVGLFASTSCRSPCMDFLPPSGGVFRLSLAGSSPCIPCRRSCGFQGATGKTETKKPSQNRPALPSLFLEGHASRLCNG